MKKRNIAAVMTALACAAAVTVYAQSGQNSPSIYLDGEKIESDVGAQIINDRTMVPLRLISEKLGAEVDWNGEERSVRIIKDGRIIDMSVGNGEMTADGTAVSLDSPPIIVNDRTLVPIRAISESFGATVFWNEEMHSVSIFSSDYSSFTHLYKSLAIQFKNGEYGEELYYLADSDELNKDSIAVYFDDDKAYIKVIQQDGRYKFRELTDKEKNEFKKCMETEKSDELADYTNPYVDDGEENQYMHFTADKISKVYMYAACWGEKESPYKNIINHFFELTEKGEFEVHYKEEERISGLQIMVENEDYEVKTVWKDGSDMRALVYDREKSDYQREYTQWYNVTEKGIGEKTTEPQGLKISNIYPENVSVYAKYDENGNMGLGGYSIIRNLGMYPWRTTWNDKMILVLENYNNFKKTGLYFVQDKEAPFLIREGIYANQTVVPDTDWVVCAKAENGWQNPNTLVKINLNTFEEFTVNIPAADYLSPIVHYNGKILVIRVENDRDYDSPTEYFWYDPVTDEIEQTSDTAKILIQCSERFLQKAPNENEYYCVGDYGVDEPTVVGKINMDTMEFTPMAEYNIYFTSMDMWVDEDNGCIYAAINGDLLKLPL